MKKTLFRLIALVLMLSLLLSTVAFAAVESSAYIAVTGAYITYSGNNITNLSVFKIYIIQSKQVFK